MESVIMYKFTEEDLVNWKFHAAYLIEILNGEYTVEEAREDLKSLIDRDCSVPDPREGSYEEENSIY